MVEIVGFEVKRRFGTVVARMFFSTIGRWLTKRWWPTERVLSEVGIAVVPRSEQGERPYVWINIGACEVSFRLQITNNTPLPIDLAGLQVTLVAQRVEIANMEFGARGELKPGEKGALYFKHTLTEYELSRAKFAKQEAKDAESFDATLYVQRLLRNQTGYHADPEKHPLPLHTQLRMN
jgi:hypothetical protein